MKKVTFSTSNNKPLDIATSKRVDGRYFTTRKLKFEVVITKAAIYVLTEVRHTGQFNTVHFKLVLKRYNSHRGRASLRSLSISTSRVR